MELQVAPHAGFCFGVEKAVNMVYDELHTEGELYTYGPIIHNETVVKDLEAHGVRVLEEDDLTTDADGKATDDAPATDSFACPKTIVLRSHGVTRREEEALRARGFRIIDATCPFVKRIHRIVAEAGENGDEILIVGDPAHAEVKAIAGWTDAPVHVIPGIAEAEGFQGDKSRGYTLVSQTTFNLKKFQEIVAILTKNDYNIHVVNTICNATEVRQTEAEDMATSVDAMIVIGGKGSSNSQKLYDICKAACERTYFIQTLDDLPKDALKEVQKVGITAGASTPKKIIEEVQNYVRTTDL